MQNRLQKARTRAGLTQKEVAETLGITPSAISLWETGTRKPDAETIFKLAEIYHCSPYWIVTGKERDRPNKGTIMEAAGTTFFVTPVVNSLRYDTEQGKVIYEELGVTAAETSVPLYRPFLEYNGRLVWVEAHVDGGMISHHIVPNSFLLVSLQDEVPDGTVSLALIGNKARCRKVYYHDGKITLVSASPLYPDRTYDADDVKIVGKVLCSAVNTTP